MARRPSKHLRPARPLSTSLARGESKRDGEWVVQPMTGGRSVKDYTCPGCNQTIPTGAPHFVVWPRTPHVGASSAVEDRRHWHSSCWNRRG